MKTMDELSNLIKEARPLYKKRQKRKAIAKLICMFTMPMILMTSICQVYLVGNDLYLSLENNTLQNELLEDDFGLPGFHNWKI